MIPKYLYPPGFVHVDLDGLWTLAGCYSYAEGESFENDPVFTLALDRLLDLFDRLEIRATFFISGRDLAHPDKARRIAAIASHGHELANHGWNHRIGMESLPENDLHGEIERTSARLGELSGKRPLGFRAPGYDAGPRVLTACAAAGILYDGSMLPTRWGGALRWMAGRLREQVRRETGAPLPDPQALAGQYGRGGSMETEWFRPAGGGSPVLRLPLAVSPGLRLPIHASMGMLPGAWFVKGALRRMAYGHCPVTYLIHGLDMLGEEELAGRLPRALAANRGFRLPLARKQRFLEEVLARLKQTSTVQLSGDWVANLPVPAH